MKNQRFFPELNKMEKKMNAKIMMASFLAIVSVLFLVATVSATDIVNTSTLTVTIDDMYADGVSVVAGDTIEVEVYFEALEDATDVRVKVDLEGDKGDSEAQTSSFDVEAGYTYKKTLTLNVPYELDDEVSDEMTMEVTIKKNGDLKNVETYDLRVQRPSYNVDVMSTIVSGKASAGETFPVDIVLKNIGYNDLEDVQVTAKISALDLEQSAYFGDLVSIEDSSCCDNNDEDTVNGRLYLNIPYDAQEGIYTLEIIVDNEDMTLSEVKQVIIENEFSDIAMRTGNEILVLNPTDKLKVYNVVTPTEESVVVIPAGSSKTVPVEISTDAEGTYNFEVLVFSGQELVDSVNFVGTKADNGVDGTTSPVVVLTVILAIIFVVLLIVLIVLLGKKPERSEDFGESYY